MKGKRNSHKFNTGDFSVLLGAHNLTKDNYYDKEEGRISECVNTINVHPDWNVHVENYWDADIAFLELANEVQFSPFIRPICIDDRRSKVAKARSGTVVGFGITENGTISNIANKLEIPIYDHLNCTKHSERHHGLVGHRSFCGGTADGRGVCLGDSGGGVYVNYNGRSYLRGLVSSALHSVEEQCDFNETAIFADVTKYYDGIKKGKWD